MMDQTRIKVMAMEVQDYMVRMRRAFHENPELSGEEYETRKLLISELEGMGVSYRVLKQGTGIIAFIEGKKPGKHRAIRADIDGLPVQEEEYNLKQKKQCVSCKEGKSHACGHDAHMAVLLGTIKVLKQLEDELCGTVYCCFEEGEETNCGVDAMLAALDEYPIDSCFALHVYAALEAGKINVTPGPRMAGTVGIGLYVVGEAGHGSRPDQAANPVVPLAHILTQIDSCFVNQIDAEETVTISIPQIEGSETSNVIPERAYMAGTARYFKKEEGEKALKIVETVAVNTAANYRCSIEFAPRNKISLLPVVNDEVCTNHIQSRIAEICGEDVLADCDKWYASECYSQYLEKYPGVLGFLGIKNEKMGSGAAHHNGQFDIDESCLWLGVCAEVGFVLD